MKRPLKPYGVAAEIRDRLRNMNLVPPSPEVQKERSKVVTAYFDHLTAAARRAEQIDGNFLNQIVR